MRTVRYLHFTIRVSHGCGILRYHDSVTTYSSRLGFASLDALEMEGKHYCTTVSATKIYNKSGLLDGLREP